MTTRTVYVVQGLYGLGPDTNEGPRPRVWKDWQREEYPTAAKAAAASRYYNPRPEQTCWHQPTAKRIVRRTITEEVVS